MRKRVDIFPTMDGEERFEDLPGTTVAKLIEKHGTTDVDVDLESNKDEARYIHYKKTLSGGKLIVPDSDGN